MYLGFRCPSCPVPLVCLHPDWSMGHYIYVLFVGMDIDEVGTIGGREIRACLQLCQKVSLTRRVNLFMSECGMDRSLEGAGVCS